MPSAKTKNLKIRSKPSAPVVETIARFAFEQAQIAARLGEVPVAAVVFDNEGSIIAHAINATEREHNPTAHAEMLAIKQACAALHSPRLPNLHLYVTLEPCPMCATAISFAQLSGLWFGAMDAKSGGVEHGACIFHQPTTHHKPFVQGGIMGKENAQLLQDFFLSRR